ncbi:hypothetical protein EYF80_045621 [Liparis tanakae]|uniref:Uncharacterized protein n=1 Tax=Liparis tanakae TaxID=230148 RepID=A0A4Z2FSJ5_9TELE|nr:hypothetical protein EYF80_045621 [Liparis tanakae]
MNPVSYPVCCTPDAFQTDLSSVTEASDNLRLLDEERCRLDATHTFRVLRFPGANVLCNDGRRWNISINYSDTDGASPDFNKALNDSHG